MRLLTKQVEALGYYIGNLIEDSAFLGKETELADAISADIKDEYATRP